MIEVNIYYQRYRKRTEIDVIEGKKWKVILGMRKEKHQRRGE